MLPWADTRPTEMKQKENNREMSKIAIDVKVITTHKLLNEIENNWTQKPPPLVVKHEKQTS